MQIMPKVIRVFLTGAIFVLSSCQGENHILAEISIPTGATILDSRVAPDNSLHEMRFALQSEKDSLVTANQIQGQITKAGYVRCAGGNESWEVISKHRDGKVIEENRLLRFFKTNNPRQLGAIYATQACSAKQSPCNQVFLVRQIDVPKSLVDGDKWVSEICENRSRTIDPTAEFKFP